jgi:hypothetical protein
LSGKRGIDIDEVLRLGPVLQAVERLGQRCGIGLGLADLGRDHVGIVGQVDPALVAGIGFRHLLGAVAQRHDPRRRTFDHRLGDREEIDLVIVVELHRDVARQFEMLFLVLAHRHMGRVIQQDVGGHQRRIGQRPRLEFSAFLPAVLSLNCVIRYIQPMRATQLKIQPVRHGRAPGSG